MGLTFNESKYRTKQKPDQRLKAPRALIVDDDVESIQPLRITLNQLGFKVEVAFNGKEALQQISHKDFEVVFLDINMPDFSGPEVLTKFGNLKGRILRPQWSRKPLPIVTYSSSELTEIVLPKPKWSFNFIEHWQKPMELPEITNRMGDLVEKLKVRLPESSNRREGP